MKVALITGASRGIGYELALALAARGATVIATATNADALKKLQDQCPDHIHIVPADICEEKDREKMIAAVARFGKIDFLVNNAGIITPLAALKDVSQVELTRLLTTNVIAPVLLTNQLIPYLSGGRVLDMSSPAAYMPVAGLGPYNISKAALDMVTNLHRMELAPYKIAVTSVLPGEVDTFMHEKLRATTHSIAKEFQQAKQSGNLMSPRVSAAFLTWLLLDTTTQDYATQKWSIYDEKHRHHWLTKDMVLPLPIRKEQQAFGTKPKDNPPINPGVSARL